MNSHKIAVMGYGVVGSGVVEVFDKTRKSIEAKLGKTAEIKYILDIVEHKGTGFDEKFINDFKIIECDPEVTVVAEVIGGVNPAFDFTKRCLEAGKSVVTSNKELVATKGAELLEIAEQNNVKYLFEASVGGGIPIIRPLRYCLVGNNITQIAGIVNGTTNFILTKMFREQMSFEDALSLAQKLGYAESNPSADVDGHDACRKICIMSSIASGKHVYPEHVYTNGISTITSADVEVADKIGYTIKLIAYYKALSNGKCEALVSPMLVNPRSRLSNISDVFNGVVVKGDAVGEASFYGPGAGKLPTASAVVSDLVECMRMEGVCEPVLWQDTKENCVVDIKDTCFPFYIRAKKSESVLNRLTSLFGAPVLSENIANQVIFITNEIKQADFENAIKVLEQSGEEIHYTLRVLN